MKYTIYPKVSKSLINSSSMCTNLSKVSNFFFSYLKTKTLGAALFCGNRTFLVLSRRHFELSRRH